MLRKLWQDECGAVISPELAIIGAILIVGILVGLAALKQAMDNELRDVGDAVEAFDFTPEVIPHDNTLSAP